MDSSLADAMPISFLMGKKFQKDSKLSLFACITGFALYVKEMKNRNSTLVVDILEESMKPKLRPSNKEKL